ncbi:MAG TPA: efflux RND transporter periplasmic adaptor subunit, partial [Clostridiaceae bacterium]|nr:efflux RND transporter periplasmic adaptor subunit [Clostridiaceae bacterium]
LDINKVSKGQKAQIKFDAIDGKTYEGSIETVAPVGVTNNNVTTYDVVTSISNTSGIKPGMNANVTIQISSKKNALVIPAEALIESNGKKYVRVESGNSALDSTGSNPASDSPSQGGSSKANTSANLPRQATSDKGKLTEIKTGLETENYIEVTEGLTEGEKVLVQLPAAESTNNANRNNFSGLGGNVRGGFGSNAPGSFGSGANANPSGNSSGTKSQTNSETKN